MPPTSSGCILAGAAAKQRAADHHDPGQQDDQSHRCLHDCRHLDADHVDGRHHQRPDDTDQHPAEVDVVTRDRPEVARLEVGEEVLHDSREGDHLEGHNADIAEDDRPGAHERRTRAQGAQTVCVFAAHQRHRGRELRIGQTDKGNHRAADQERRNCAEAAGRIQPCAGQCHPAPADHGAEGQRQDLSALEDADQLALPSHRSRAGIGIAIPHVRPAWLRASRRAPCRVPFR